jgi:hypothetical protein
MSEKKYFIIAGNRLMEPDLDFSPTPLQLENAARRAKDDPYIPRKRFPAWFPALAIALVIGAIYGLVLLWSSL